ncbi:MAG: carbamoyl-phosphate synthase large subunit, partial [Chloroflexia bacterium]
EPALDYVVVKMPRWPFDKFRGVDKRIGMTMKSTGEVMAIGRSFEQALFKALRSLDTRSSWLEVSDAWTPEAIAECLANPTHERPAAIYNALMQGWCVEKISRLSGIHPWFIMRFKAIGEMERRCREGLTDDVLREAKQMGFSDEQLISLDNSIPGETSVQKNLVLRRRRRELGIMPTYKMVDTCAGEFAATTPYFYSTYETEDEAEPMAGAKVIVLGSGPIRIGQGIEFDYSAVHAVESLKEAGIKALVINNNPETVSTDYHLSDRLYFEPLTLEEVLNVVESEQEGLLGVIAQVGGQTALNLINLLVEAGVRILGTSPESIAATEDRKQMAAVCERLRIPVPAWTIAHSQEELETFAPRIGFPVLVRPSYVLGGRGMKIVQNHNDLRSYLSGLGSQLRKHPVLIDRFLEGATEIDVDGVSDGKEVFAVIMEQIEHAGVHSGDSSCVYPPQNLTEQTIEQIEIYTRSLARELGIVGFINVQYALHKGKVYLLEVNARASRTVPFASKAAGVPLARIATRLIMGATLDEFGLKRPAPPSKVSVKSVVLPFDKFPLLDRILGPEMKSTGESMGTGATFAEAYEKAQIGAGYPKPSV